MAPFKVRACCVICPWKRTGYALKTTEAAERHADKFTHDVDIWRLRSGGKSYYVKVRPQIPQEF